MRVTERGSAKWDAIYANNGAARKAPYVCT